MEPTNQTDVQKNSGTQDNPKSSPLNVGQIVGIAIAAFICCVALLLLLYCTFFYKDDDKTRKGFFLASNEVNLLSEDSLKEIFLDYGDVFNEGRDDFLVVNPTSFSPDSYTPPKAPETLSAKKPDTVGASSGQDELAAFRKRFAKPSALKVKGPGLPQPASPPPPESPPTVDLFEEEVILPSVIIDVPVPPATQQEDDFSPQVFLPPTLTPTLVATDDTPVAESEVVRSESDDILELIYRRGSIARRKATLPGGKGFGNMDEHI